jgi:hypothetical protein
MHRASRIARERGVGQALSTGAVIPVCSPASGDAAASYAAAT